MSPVPQHGPPSPPMDPVTPPPADSVSARSNSPPATAPSHYRPATMIVKDMTLAPATKSPDSVMTNSISFALLNSLDGKLIDNLLDEVDEDEQKHSVAAAIGPVTLYKQRSKSARSISSRSNQSISSRTMSRSKSPRAQSPPISTISTSTKSTYAAKRRMRPLNESSLGFDVLSVNGDMIDAILDEVDDKERLIVAHEAMQKGPADLNALAAATNVADEAIASMNAMLSFFQQKTAKPPQ